MKVRKPCQAGGFYAKSPTTLRGQLDSCFTHQFGPGTPSIIENGPRKVVGLVCPHAGYMYSGPIAAHSYHILAGDGKPDVIIILGPNHSGQGNVLALMNEGAWRTPLGDVSIDEKAANKLLRKSEIIDVDPLAHMYEHSIEVQLPFLQYLYGSTFKFVPISFLLQDFESSYEVGKTIAETFKGDDILIIASTDFSHYEPYKIAQEKDSKALSALEQLDERQFYSAIEKHHISACGYGPVTALVSAVKILGANKARILCYKTSGDIAGEYSAVVGYASVAFTRD